MLLTAALALPMDGRPPIPDAAVLADLVRCLRPAATADDAAVARRLPACATIEGARPLGVDDLVGSLTPGKYADLAVVAVATCDDPHRGILDRAGAESVRCTVLAGRVVHEASGA